MQAKSVSYPSIAALLVVTGWLVAGCDSPEAAPAAEAWLRIDASGHAATTEAHDCVLDRRTGLMWEVKRAEPGLHYHENSYTWFSTDRDLHMTEPGTPRGGTCDASACDTEGFVAAVNEDRLCGYSDWYLPSRDELMTLGDSRLVGTGLVIERAFFPHARAREFWTAETFRLYPDSAWIVNAGHGLDRVDLKKQPKAVRLVRRHQAPVDKLR